MNPNRVTRSRRQNDEQNTQFNETQNSEASNLGRSSDGSETVIRKQTALEKFAEHVGVLNVQEETDVHEFTIREEIKTYKLLISNNQKMLEAWGGNTKIEKLKELAKMTCISPASSVPAESAFSTANYLMRKERMALKPESLRAQIILADEDKLNKVI